MSLNTWVRGTWGLEDVLESAFRILVLGGGWGVRERFRLMLDRFAVVMSSVALPRRTRDSSCEILSDGSMLLVYTTRIKCCTYRDGVCR